MSSRRRIHRERKARLWERSFALLLFIVPGITTVPVMPYGLIALLLSALLLVHMYLTLEWVEDDSTLDKLVGAWCVVLLVGTIAFPFLPTKWREEQAAANEGELVAPSDGQLYPDSDVRFQIGARADGTLMTWTGPQGADVLKIVGSKLNIRRENGKLLVSTEVREKQSGNVIVSIIDNVWQTSNLQSVVWDKNYTANALEVKDGRGRVVFQIILLADRVRFQGEWWHEDGYGGLIMRPFPYDPIKGGPIIQYFTPTYHPEEGPQIQPMFRYPSKKHWSELAPGFTLP